MQCLLHDSWTAPVRTGSHLHRKVRVRFHIRYSQHWKRCILQLHCLIKCVQNVCQNKQNFQISGDSCTQTLTGFSEPLYEKISWYVTFPCWTGVGFQDSVKLYHSPNKAKLSSLMRSGITPRLPFPSTKNQQRHLFIVPSNNVNAIKNEMLLHSKHVHQLQPFAIWLIWMIIRLISKHITYV